MYEISQKNKVTLQQEINNWLEEEKYAFGITYDPNRDLTNIDISFDDYAGCNIILSRNNLLILIATKVSFSEEDKKIFAYLKKENKQVFIRELERSLSQANVQYSLYPDPENLEYIQIRYLIYSDDLTKSNLLYGLSQVKLAVGLAQLVYRIILHIAPYDGQYRSSFFN